MWSKLEEVFEEVGLPYSRQGSYEEQEKLPDSFFTFWNTETPNDGFFDNKANCRIWNWTIYFYTNNPELIYSKMDEFVTLAKENNFLCDGNAKDIPSNEPNYFGRYILIRYIEKY